MSECSLYDIVTIRDGICLTAFYMILLKCSWYMSECCIYDNIKMRFGIFLYALHIV